MVNNRNGFTYGANITILTIALILFSVMTDAVDQFRILCFCALGLGLSTTTFYLFTIREVKLETLANEYDALYKKKLCSKVEGDDDKEAGGDDTAKETEKKPAGKDAKAWLKEGSFYIHGIVYMVVRIAVNVTMTI